MTEKKKEEDYHGKYCPIRQSKYPALKCLEEKCMFWAIKKKSHVNKDGNLIFVDADGYCLVRDFLLTMINRE